MLRSFCKYSLPFSIIQIGIVYYLQNVGIIVFKYVARIAEYNIINTFNVGQKTSQEFDVQDFKNNVLPKFLLLLLPKSESKYKYIYSMYKYIYSILYLII